MRHVVTACLLLVALVHALPVTGVGGTGPLAALYGVQVRDPDIEILLRHRAVFFGLVALLLGASAFHPPLRTQALGVGIASVGSFLLVAWQVGGCNASLQRVVQVDVLALAALAVAALLHWRLPAAA